MQVKDSFGEASAVLPGDIRERAMRLSQSIKTDAEEIRLRLGRRPQVISRGSHIDFSERAVDENDLSHLLQIATKASPHRALSDMRSGFVSIPGGHRLGLCGTVSVREREVINLSPLSSVCIRIARQHPGIAGQHICLLTKDGAPLSTLIIAPPGAGKTTYLRDLVRLLSNGAAGRKINIGLADERGEVAAFSFGRAMLDVGENTDVMSMCSKARAVIMLLRSMAPEAIAVDEITAKEDAGAMLEAHGCGVKLIATAHAAGFEDLLENGLYAELLQRGVFERLVTVKNCGKTRKYEVRVLDKTAWSHTYGGGHHMGGALCRDEPETQRAHAQSLCGGHGTDGCKAVI